MAWLNGWTYRKAITITEQSGSDLTNFQKRIDLDNTNFDFTKAKADGSDIRITTSDGTTLLDIWKEEWDATNQIGKIWVKIPSLLANSSVTLYLYYGNPDAVDVDNPNAVFIFFDKISNGANWNFWGDPPGVVDTTVGNPAPSIKGNGDGYYHSGATTKMQFNYYGTALRIDAMHKSNLRRGRFGFDVNQTYPLNAVWQGLVFITLREGETTRRSFSVRASDGTVEQYVEDWGGYGEWHTYEICIRRDGIVSFYVDGVHKWTSTKPADDVGFAWISVMGHDPEFWYDNFILRNYTEPEPLVSVGIEETSGGVVYSESLLDTVSLSESSKSMLSIINADSINAVSLEKQNPHTGQSDAVPVLDAQKFDVVNINRSIATIVEIERLNTLNKLLELSTLIDYLKSNPTVPESDVATLNDVLSYVTLRVQSLSDVSVVNDANTINALNRALESVTTIESLSPSLSAKIKEFVALVDKILAIIAGLNRDSLTLTDALTESIISGAQTQTILDGLVVGDSLIMDLLAIHAAKIALSDLLKTDSTDAMVDSVGIFETIAVDTALRILNSLTASETLTAVPVTILQELIPTLELLTSESNKLLIVLSDIISALDIDKALVTGKLKDSIDAEDLLQVIAYQLAAAIVSLLSKIALLAALESVTAVLEQNKSIINQKVNLESGTTSLKGGQKYN